MAWRRVAWVALAAFMVASAALIWTWGNGLTLIDDEWGYALRTATEPAHTYLLSPPPGKHLIAVPLVFYKAAFDIFGISSDVPYQVAHLVLLLLCAGLFFALARRRVGDLLAVLSAAILLFLGPAREVVATPLRIPSLISTAAGLGMLLFLERRDRKGDVLACLLLAVSLASLSTGYPFAAAAAVLVLTRRSPERWRRSWVVLIPVVLYAIWWVLEFQIGPNAQPVGSTILGLPIFLGKSLGATVLSVTGLVSTTTTGTLSYPLALYVVAGGALIVLLAAAFVARLRRPERLSPFFWAIVAALLVFWTATAFAPGPERVPWASRYLYLDAVLFLLLLSELARGLDVPRRLTRAGWAVALIAFTISIVGNARELHTQTRVLVQDSSYIRAGLTSLEMARTSVAPTFRLDTTLGREAPVRKGLLGDELENNGIPLGHITAAGFQRVFDDYGSPAYTPTELDAQQPGIRQAADVVLARALRLRLHPSSASLAGSEPAPKPIDPLPGDWRSPSAGCVELPNSTAAQDAVVSLATGGATIHAGPRQPTTVSIGRFAEGTPVQLGSVPAGGFAELRIPADSPGEESSVPWRLGIADAAGVTVCGHGAPAPG